MQGKQPRPSWNVVVVCITLALLIALAGFGAHQLYRRAGVKELEANWQLTVPDGLVLVERHSESSFHGDGYRFKGLRAKKDAPLAGTFFDPSSMSSQDLTPVEHALVNSAHETFQPEHKPDLSQPGWRKNSATRRGPSLPSEVLLCLHNEGSDLFFVYENLF